MKSLINLLSWQPGFSGFDTFIKNVIPLLPGEKLQINSEGIVEAFHEDKWLPLSPAKAKNLYLNVLQRFSLLQFGVDINQILINKKLLLRDYDVIYSPFFDSLLGVMNIPLLITCPDLTPLRSPISYRSYLRYKYFQPIHLSLATKITTYSHYVSDQLIDIGFNSKNLEVIPCGINTKRKKVEKPFSEDLLVIARHDTNKNLLFLLECFTEFQKQKPSWMGTLRIIGKFGKQTFLMKKLIKKLPKPNQIKLIESLDYNKLVDFIRSSYALISASKEEGFDYPILEAKAEGIPTLISDIKVHREFHENTSLFFSIDNGPLPFCFMLNSILKDNSLWSELSSSGYKLAQEMTVKKQADHILNTLNNLGSNGI